VNIFKRYKNTNLKSKFFKKIGFHIKKNYGKGALASPNLGRPKKLYA
jgi:hypothetical protein